MAEVRVPTLEMRGISKTFPGVKALNGVQLKAWGGEVQALMGENGAGKSTLMKILSGAYQADAGGEILIDGQPVQITDPIAAKRAGIAIIYQELSLAPNLTVAENIYLGDEIAPPRPVDRKAMARRLPAGAGAAGRTVQARDHRSASCRSPSSSWSRSRARCTPSPRSWCWTSRPRPCPRARPSGCSRLIRQLRGEGIALIYISHRMAEVYELSDRVSVLRDGTYVGTLDRDELTADALVKMMVGRDLSSFYTKEHDPHGSRGPVILEVKGITDGGRRVQAGELPAARGRGPGHRRAGRLGPHRARPPDLRRRPQGRRRGAAGRPAGRHQRGPRTRWTAASPT